MQEVSNEDLLTAWELGRAEPQLAMRALTILSAGYPGVSYSALSDLSIGERDALLFTLREHIFGSTMTGRTACPSCGEGLQVQFNVADVIAPSDQSGQTRLTLAADEYEFEFRLPCGLDLLAISNVAGLEEKRIRLIERVIVRASHKGKQVSYLEIPEHLIAKLEQAMEEADPQADVQLNLRCSVCGREWRSLFDVVSFLWRELDAWALRLLREVHSLARGYGWREADILHMRPWRRQCYLEMLGA